MKSLGRIVVALAIDSGRRRDAVVLDLGRELSSAVSRALWEAKGGLTLTNGELSSLVHRLSTTINDQSQYPFTFCGGCGLQTPIQIVVTLYLELDAGQRVQVQEKIGLKVAEIVGRRFASFRELNSSNDALELEVIVESRPDSTPTVLAFTKSGSTLANAEVFDIGSEFDRLFSGKETAPAGSV